MGAEAGLSKEGAEHSSSEHNGDICLLRSRFVATVGNM